MKKLIYLICFVFITGGAFASSAINFDPFDGGPFPDSTRVIMLYGLHGGANTIKRDGDTVSRNSTFQQNIGLFRVAIWEDMFSIPWHFSLIMPYGDVSLDGEATGNQGVSASGLGDMQLIISPTILRWDGGYFNVGLRVDMPTGDYHHNAAMNMGTNRWGFMPNIVIAQNVGRFHFDLWGGCEFYTDNDNYGPAKDKLDKVADYFTELHSTYIISPETMTYASLSLGGLWGGKEKLDSIKVKGNANDYAAKLSIGTNITESANILVSFKKHLQVENGPQGYEGAIRIMRFF